MHINFFQDSFRRLGAWLDAASARSIIVVQRSGGFAVRYYRQDIDTVFLQRFFTDEEVRSLERGDIRVRRRFARGMRRQVRGICGEAGGYQDILRALGYLLDSEAATQVRLTEDEERAMLSVSRLGPDGTEMVSLFGPEERETFRKQAQARRAAEES